MEMPRTGAELAKLVYGVNWHRETIPNLASLLAPFRDLLEGLMNAYGSRKKRGYENALVAPFLHESIDYVAAFEILRSALVNAVELAWPNPEYPKQIVADASKLGWCSYLMQCPPEDLSKPLPDRKNEILSIDSGTFSGSELGWSTNRMEAYAVFKIMEKNDHLSLSNSPVQVFTDNQGVQKILNQGSEKSIQANEAVKRLCEKILATGIVMESHYIRSEDNHLADFISRRQLGIDDAFREYKEKVQLPIKNKISKAKLNELRSEARELHDKDHSSNTSLIHEYHRRHQEFPKRMLYGFLKEVKDECPICIMTSREKEANLKTGIHEVEEQYYTLHMDFAELGTDEKFLLVVDGFSKKCWIFSVKNSNAEAVITSLTQLFDGNMGLRELPKKLRSDGAMHFQSKAVKEFLQERNIEQDISPSRSPASNGLVERAVQEVIKAVRIQALMNSRHVEEWRELLPEVHNYMNKRRRLDSLLGMTPNEVYEQSVEGWHKYYGDLVRKRRDDMLKQHVSSSGTVPNPKPGDLVLLSKEYFAERNLKFRKILPTWFGPFRVKEVSRKGFEVSLIPEFEGFTAKEVSTHSCRTKHISGRAEEFAYLTEQSICRYWKKKKMGRHKGLPNKSKRSASQQVEALIREGYVDPQSELAQASN